MIKTPEYLTTHVKHILTLAPERGDSVQESLPTSKPVSPQKSFTIQSSDIPVFDPPVANFKNLVFIYMGARNDTGATQTYYVDVEKNGVSYQSWSGNINDGTYGSYTIYAYDIQEGDVFDFYLWSTDAGVNYYKCGMLMAPTQIRPQNDKVLKNVRFDNWVDAPNFSGGAHYHAYHVWQLGDVTFYFDEYDSFDTLKFGSWWSDKDSYILRMHYGDNGYRDGESYWSNATMPYHNASKLPQTIEYDIVQTRKGD